MKTALYIERGVLQVVLTPETADEKAVLRLVEHRDMVRMYRGSFYECRGGWFRHETVSAGPLGEGGHTDDDSLILVLAEPPAAHDAR